MQVKVYNVYRDQIGSGNDTWVQLGKEKKFFPEKNFNAKRLKFFFIFLNPNRANKFGSQKKKNGIKKCKTGGFKSKLVYNNFNLIQFC